jgi:hypothetical protein
MHGPDFYGPFECPAHGTVWPNALQPPAEPDVDEVRRVRDKLAQREFLYSDDVLLVCAVLSSWAVQREIRQLERQRDEAIEKLAKLGGGL